MTKYGIVCRFVERNELREQLRKQRDAERRKKHASIRRTASGDSNGSVISDFCITPLDKSPYK